MYMLEGISSVTNFITVLMKSLNKTETPILISSVLCFQRQSF